MTQHHFPLELTLTLLCLLAAVAGPVLTRHRRRLFRLMVLVSGLLVVAVAVVWLLANRSTSSGPQFNVSDAQVQAIIHKRCSECHAAHPTEPGYTRPPAGLILENLQQVRSHAHAVYKTAVASHFMPLGNITNITSAERAALGHWIDQQ